MLNLRYDPFTQQDLSVLVTGETVKVPGTSPYYVPLLEVPRLEQPSTVLVRAAGSSGSVVADRNCYIKSNNTSFNDYTTANLTVGKNFTINGGELYRAFLHFDITSLASTADLAIVRINLSSLGNTPVAVGVHKVTSSWVESGPTWGSPPTYDPVPAGSFNLVPDIKGTIVGGWVDIDITALYNAWKAGTVTNNGIMLKADESVDGSWFYFAQRSQLSPPTLVVVGAGSLLQEVAATVTPVSGQFACHYPTGILRFHSSAAGSSYAVDYRGTGSPIDAQHVTFYAGVTAGTSTAFTVTIPALQRLTDGTMIQALMHANCTGSSTLNPNGFGAKTIKRLGSNLTSSQLASGVVYTFIYDKTNDVFHVQGI